jgi:hypothetical protein
MGIAEDGVAWLVSNGGQDWRVAWHPPPDAVDVADLDAAFRQQLLDVAVGQSEAQVPEDSQDDDVGREAKAGEGGPRNGSGTRAVGSHPVVSLLAHGHGERNSVPLGPED